MVPILSSECRSISSDWRSGMSSARSPSPRRRSLPAVPQLELHSIDDVPFSESFSGLLESSFNECSINASFHVPPDVQDVSYDIKCFTDISAIIPGWDDEEIDEILVISPKTSGRLSTIAEGGSDADSLSTSRLSDLELLQFPSNVPVPVNATVCTRKHDTGRVHIVKSLRDDEQVIGSEHYILKIVAKLECPFLPRIHQEFRDEKSAFLIMDYYPNGCLSAYISQNDLRPALIRIYSSEILDGIECLHNAGIVHRGLNPENIMIDASGHIVLTDFSCSKIIGSSHVELYHREVSLCQTEYQAPEMILSWTDGLAVDSWGFGMLLYYMICKENPFVGPNGYKGKASLQQRILGDPIQFDHLLDIDPAAKCLIDKCLKRNPSLRINIQGIKNHHYFTVNSNWRDTAEKARASGSQYDSNKLDIRSSQDVGSIKLRSPPVYKPYGPGQPVKSDNQLPISLSTRAQPQGLEMAPDIFQKSSCGSLVQVPCVTADPGHKPTTIPTDGRSSDRASDVKDRMTLFWETFDEGGESAPSSAIFDSERISHLSLRPRKLQKQRSSADPRQRFSLFSLSSSNVNRVLQGPEQIRTPLLQTRKIPTLALPKGIEQIGHGIGFTYNVPAATISKASICTASTPRACHGGFPKIGLGLRKMKQAARPKAETQAERREVDYMREMYGSSWSLSLGMSPVTNYSLSPSSPTAVNSPNSDTGPFTPADTGRNFLDTTDFNRATLQLGAKDGQGDPNATLRLVSSNADFSEDSEFLFSPCASDSSPNSGNHT